MLRYKADRRSIAYAVITTGILIVQWNLGAINPVLYTAGLFMAVAVAVMAHNHNHLLEQPTLFYAIALVLALQGGGAFWLNVWLAWAYVGFRVIHSLIQSTVNVVRWRFLAHLAASLCLFALTLHAAMHVLHLHL